MAIQLGISLGTSFAEYCLIDTRRPNVSLSFSRHYLPTENLTNSLKIFLEKNSDVKINQVCIASRVLEKILDTRLGGSVAQIVTQGFENWPLLRQSLSNPYFEIFPTRTEALASQDLIFGIHERINAQGKVIKKVKISELEQIAEKLKLQKIEKICVNLLFSEINNTHLNSVTQFFKEKGFQVFSSEGTENYKDEILSWRRNLLNASLAGTAQEIHSEIMTALEGRAHQDQIFYFDGSGKPFHFQVDRLSSSLFGPYSLIANKYQDDKQILFLGMEKWYLIKPQSQKKTWDSPWGPLGGQIPNCQPLRLQPTSELTVDEFETLEWSPAEVGFEPGPMMFGRALKPTVFDALLIDSTDECFSPFIQENGKKKFRDTVHAMIKNSNSKETKFERILGELEAHLVDQIALKVLLEQESRDRSLTCTGIFAHRLLPQLKARWPEIEWKLCPYSREIEGLSVATQEIK